VAKNKTSEKNIMDKGHPRPPALYVFMGLPASGKSVLARTWARKHQFSYFNADVVCEQLVGQQISWQQAKQSPLMMKRTYGDLLTFAEQELAAGRTVVLDAFYGASEERARLTKLAEKLKTIPHFALCYCSEKLAQARLAERASGSKAALDAQWQNFKKQQKNLKSLDDLEPTMVVSVNTGAPQES
jgi:predicted kinase